MRKITLLFALVFTSIVMAQVTTVPGIIQKGYDGEITIIFNPNEGNKGMVGATQCYAHTGLITTASSSDSDWKNVVEEWRKNTAKTQLTKDGDNWKIVIPNIYDFYGCPKSTEIKKLAFVFHDGPSGSKEGKTAESKDIFVELAEAGLAASISTSMLEISSVGGQVSLTCYATASATLTLKLNGAVVKTATGTEMAYTHQLDKQGNYDFELTATNGTETATATASTCVPYNPTKANRPAGIVNGIYYDKSDNTKVTLCTFAGSKTEPAKHVFVVGDFNDWTISNDYQLKQANDSAYFWIELTGLTPQKEYAMQYVVVRADGVVKRISDLYSELVLHSDDSWEPSQNFPNLKPYPAAGEGYVTVIQTDKPEFEWSDATLNFKRPNKNNLVIYELWVRDHTPARTFEALMERMEYFEDLGVNAIELMPICEFDGNDSWGYNPNHYFAVDKSYGTSEQLKDFIDECHKRGIAVIIDMVFNHTTGQNPMAVLYPYGNDLKYNPWYNNSGSIPHKDREFEPDWNHDFGPTKTMFIRCFQYWLNEYKVDGFRLDLSHGLCGTTDDDVEHLQEYYANGVQAVSSDAYMILEHWDSGASTLVNAGMMCWENTSEAYQETAMGWYDDKSGSKSDLSRANKDDYVSYCESHDEERSFFKAKQWGDGAMTTDEAVRVGRVPLNMAFLTLLNGPQMFYHFAELGFDDSKFQNEDSKWGKNDYGITSELGADYDAKTQVKKRIEHWLLEGTVQMAAFQKVGQIIQLRTRIMPEVFEGNPTAATLTDGKALRTIQWGSDVFVAGNFAASGNQTVNIPSGTWYNYLQETQQSGSTLTLAPGEVVVLTGKQVALPKMPAGYKFKTDIEDIVVIEPTEMLPPYNVQVYTLSGQMIERQVNVMQADLSGLKSGLYILQYEKNGQKIAKKLIR